MPADFAEDSSAGCTINFTGAITGKIYAINVDKAAYSRAVDMLSFNSIDKFRGRKYFDLTRE